MSNYSELFNSALTRTYIYGIFWLLLGLALFVELIYIIRFMWKMIKDEESTPEAKMAAKWLLGFLFVLCGILTIALAYDGLDRIVFAEIHAVNFLNGGK